MSEIITTAKPHTIKKFEIIKNYTDEWARKILGMPKSTGLVFIDCMCNSGFYKDEDGNVIEGTATLVAKKLNEIAENYPGKTIELFYNDLDKSRVEYLKSKLDNLKLNRISITYSNKDCNEFLRNFPLNKYSTRNVLLVYDPYQASIDWNALNPFLNAWGEVIINHMIQDTERGAKQAVKKVAIDKYQKTYHKQIDEIIESANDKDQLDKIIVDIIKEQTNDNRRERFIASFPFFNRKNRVVYNLVFCSGNVKGIVLFKKIAWKAFGGHSSMKARQDNETQLSFFSDGNDEFEISTITDDHCYNVMDIAKYVYQKYSPQGEVNILTIYDDLDRHPIFPSDGYKKEIMAELKAAYNVKTLGTKDNRRAVFG